MTFREQTLQKIVTGLRSCPSVLAVWEGGSAANATTDQYSDIDLCILARDPLDAVFQRVESELKTISEISHLWNEPKSIWPELTQKIYILKDSPKHFFVDVGVFPENSPNILTEFMQIERHGRPIVHFDETGRIKAVPVNKEAILEKQRRRLSEITGAYPIYRTEVLKELDRGHAIDAIGFYHSAMVRPWVEVLGMLYRPYQFDFALRYLDRSFPPELCRQIEKYLYVPDPETLRKNTAEVEKHFYATVEQVKQRLNGGSDVE